MKVVGDGEGEEGDESESGGLKLISGTLSGQPSASPLGTGRQSLLAGDSLQSSGNNADGVVSGRDRAFSDDWMAAERRTDVAAQLHDVSEEGEDDDEDENEGGGGIGAARGGGGSEERKDEGNKNVLAHASGSSPSTVQRHKSWRDAQSSAMKKSARSLVMGKKRRSLLPGDKVFAQAHAGAGEVEEGQGQAGATARKVGQAGAPPMRLRSGSLVERGDGSDVHGAIAAAVSRPRRGNAGTHHARHGKDGYHKPAGFFHTHERRARMWMRFVAGEHDAMHKKK